MPAPWLWSAPVLWLVLGTALITLALLGIDTDGLILVGGITALVLTLLTALAPLPPLLGVALFVLVAGAGYGWLRRWSRQQRTTALPSSSHAEQAEVISGFGEDDRESGRVLWQGQSWAAVNLKAGRLLEPGAQVLVMGRDGTHLQVLPK
ncbi:NfeD family protein [Synechococcus sp. FGCU-3]|nr:NfeD family protein [Synechococcus sp. FGCU3]